MYYPLNYEKINLYNGTFLPSHKHEDSLAFDFWCRALFQRALSVFDFEDLPDTFSREEINLMYYLYYVEGYSGLMDVEDYDVIINPVALKGYNIFFGPDSFILTNAVLDKSIEYKIYHKGMKKEEGVNYGVVLQMSPDYTGIWDIIMYYADKLANMSCALDMNIDNSKLAYVLGANTNSGKSFLKKVFDKIKSGVSTIIYDSRITPSDDIETFEFLTRDNIKNSYLVSDFNSDIQTLVNQFDAEVGIVNVPYEKKERMTEFESKSKQSDGIARATLWRDTMQRSWDDANELYGYNVKVVYNYEYMLDTESGEEGGFNNE